MITIKAQFILSEITKGKIESQRKVFIKRIYTEIFMKWIANCQRIVNIACKVHVPYSQKPTVKLLKNVQMPTSVMDKLC
jgi:hypothetical protein